MIPHFIEHHLHAQTGAASRAGIDTGQGDFVDCYRIPLGRIFFHEIVVHGVDKAAGDSGIGQGREPGPRLEISRQHGEQFGRVHEPSAR